MRPDNTPSPHAPEDSEVDITHSTVDGSVYDTFADKVLDYLWDNGGTKSPRYAAAIEFARDREGAYAEIERLRAEVAGLQSNIERLMDPNIVAMSIRDGGLDMNLEGTSCRMLAESFASEFQKGGGVNYLECRFTSKEVMPGEGFVVTVQRINGKTPHQLRADAESQLAELRRRVAEAHVFTAVQAMVCEEDGEYLAAQIDLSADMIGRRFRLLPEEVSDGQE